MAFAGTYEHTLDAKNRLSVPTRFRSSLSGSIVLAQDSERCMTVWPKNEYDAETAAILAPLNAGGARYQKIKRFRNANSFDAELDGSGRVGLPGSLIGWAGLDREVTVIGAGDHLEIWDRAAWAGYNDGLADEIKQIQRELDEQ